MDLLTVDELLTTPRSIRKRLDLTRQVERSVIQECLELAIQAPTGGDMARYHARRPCSSGYLRTSPGGAPAGGLSHGHDAPSSEASAGA